MGGAGAGAVLAVLAATVMTPPAGLHWVTTGLQLGCYCPATGGTTGGLLVSWCLATWGATSQLLGGLLPCYSAATQTTILTLLATDYSPTTLPLLAGYLEKCWSSR